jgi:hypothetical protein
MNYIDNSLPKITDFPTVKSNLDYLTDIVIKFQERFYCKVFGIKVDFSSFSSLLKRVDIPSENMTVFISDVLSNEKLFSVAEEILKLKIDIPKIRKDIKRKSPYIISISKEEGEEKDFLTLREIIIMELFLKTQRNTLISNYLPGLLVCKGTRFFLDKNLKYSNPYFFYYKPRERYSIGYVRQDCPCDIKTPVVSIYNI